MVFARESDAIIFTPWPNRWTGTDQARVYNTAWGRAINRFAQVLGETIPTISATGGVATQADVETVNRVDRWGSVTSQWIEAHAPDAPDTVRNEALIRMAAWLRDTRGADRGKGLGTLDIEPAPLDAGRAARYSGAILLLEKWRVRGIGICEDDS